MNILFIGNSYTYFNDMPFLLQSLLNENGIDARVDAVTRGGRKLMEHLLPNDELGSRIDALLALKKYDVLFLQEQSYFPIVGFEDFERSVITLKNRVGACRTLLYSTWGRKTGCQLLADKGWTSEGMYDSLTEAYRRAAGAAGAEISPVGRVFAGIIKNSPETELYNKDMSHPSYIGSCAAAVTHFKSITGRLPEKCATLGLAQDVLDILLTAAGSVKE